ncbi:hypothetical protein L1049_013991 [Liquidambar formosana]|uniref:Uncharacterized protein n=1 Tax=Liquidambar formosana TaxID=63359 RepID=A0AAP0RMM9_LIQFO
MAIARYGGNFFDSSVRGEEAFTRVKISRIQRDAKQALWEIQATLTRLMMKTNRLHEDDKVCVDDGARGRPIGFDIDQDYGRSNYCVRDYTMKFHNQPPKQEVHKNFEDPKPEAHLVIEEEDESIIDVKEAIESIVVEAQEQEVVVIPNEVQLPLEENCEKFEDLKEVTF